MKKEYRLSSIWIKTILMPVIIPVMILGYIITSVGVVLKILGYFLRLDKDNVLKEIIHYYPQSVVPNNSKIFKL